MSLKNPRPPSVGVSDLPHPSDAASAPVDIDAVMTGVGETAYEWTIGDDSLRWAPNALTVLGLPSWVPISSGSGFASLLDPANAASRQDAILNSAFTDDGSGVGYEAQYAFFPEGPRGRRRLMVEDIGRWYADDSGRPQRAAGVLRIINERYEREQRLAFLSRYDELTGYLNRAHLLSTLGETLAGARRQRSAIAFMIVAVDNFRAINEAYGFEIADRMFAAVADRIKASLREGDAIGRFSGAKLGVIVLNCDERDMHVAAERFHAAVRQEVIITEAGSVAATVSIGAVSIPRHANSAVAATARAQEALHEARLLGYGHFAAYTQSPDRTNRRRANAALSSDVVAAFNEHRFVLGFQPVADAATRATVFHEALLRMRRPNHPTSKAADFVVLAERLGLIRLIDQRCLELVAEALLSTSEARLSFNISAETVGDGQWLAQLSAAVAQRPELAKRLAVEITETAVMRNLDEAARFVGLLHDLGCEVALDDFGAGFSSFRSLRDLGVDLVKIDGSFVEKLVTNRDDQSFARALIDLARNFGIKTVAEKVQDEESAQLLASWGVNYLQGNLVGTASLDRPT